MHGIAWFADAPDVQQLLAAEDYADLLTGVEDIVSYADSIVSTINPAISIDGSNAERMLLEHRPSPTCATSHMPMLKISTWIWLR